MADIAELESAARAANAALSRAQAKQRAEENGALVGRFYKYHNSYSCPEKPSDRWWLYIRVESVDGYCIKCLKFETDKYGKVEIEPRHNLSFRLGDGYQEITAAEFNKAWRATKKKIAAW